MFRIKKLIGEFNGCDPIKIGQRFFCRIYLLKDKFIVGFYFYTHQNLNEVYRSNSLLISYLRKRGLKENLSNSSF
jgi:hypothetical protein